jgi:hypothetical protein
MTYKLVLFRLDTISREGRNLFQLVSSLEQELLQERKASSRNEEEVKSVILATEAKLEETARTLMAKV